MMIPSSRILLRAKPLTASSAMPLELPQNNNVGEERQQISELQFDKFPNPQSFWVWKVRFKNRVTTSEFPSDAQLWIKEVETVDSLDELKTSRSVCRKVFPNFDSPFKKVSLEEQEAQNDDRFLRGRQIAFMVYDYFRVTGVHDSAGLRWFVLCYSSWLRFKMGRSSIVFVKYSIRWFFGKYVQMKNIHMVRSETYEETTTSRLDDAWPNMWKIMSRSTTPDNWEECSSLNKTTKTSSSQWKPLVQTWMFRCQQQSFAKYRCRQNMIVLWMSTKARDQVLKELDANLIKTTLLQKRWTSITRYSLVHKFIPTPQALKFQMQRRQWRQNAKHWRAFRHGSWRKSETSKKWSKKQGRVHFVSLMDLCHLQKSELKPQYHKIQRQSRIPTWFCRRWFWFVCSFHWTRIISISNHNRKSHGHYILASRMFRTSSRCSIRSKIRSKWKMHRRYSKIP